MNTTKRSNIKSKCQVAARIIKNHEHNKNILKRLKYKYAENFT